MSLLSEPKKGEKDSKCVYCKNYTCADRQIACYQNKVSEFRSGVWVATFYTSYQTDLSETDLSEVLQIEQVFTNVPKGLVAKKEDWQKAFNTDDINKVIEEVRNSKGSSLTVDPEKRRSPNQQPRADTSTVQHHTRAHNARQ
jgi:ribosome maturation protein Sdo1